ncbi:MAG: NAD(+)/NADH kinase [Candidatus Aquicultorales bacterium]
MSERKSGVRRVAIVPHLGKPKVGEVGEQLIGWLESRGMEVALCSSDAVQMDRPDLAQDDAVFPDADLAVSLGGDGTILRTFRVLDGKEIPVVGVNLGTLGFLSVVEVSDLMPAMERILEGEYTVDERMMLECRVVQSSGETAVFRALNEVVVERGERQRMIRLDVNINDLFFSRFTADGLILATPTGSTAYSFSAGGPVVAPSNEVVVMTPISPHSLFGRSVIIHPNDKVKIDIPDEIETSVGIDGVVVAKSLRIDSILVGKARGKALLVQVGAEDFYGSFRKKLRFWDFWTERD